MTALHFAYGANMSRAVMQKYAPGARPLGAAELADHRFVITADGFTRRGQYADAANFLRNAVSENPGDGEAWVALGNVLVEHAEGQPTAAALYAYSRAEALLPANPAPAYFLGLSLLRAGRPGETRALWAELLASAPGDAPWREALAERLARLDAMLGTAPEAAPVTGPAREQ